MSSKCFTEKEKVPTAQGRAYLEERGPVSALCLTTDRAFNEREGTFMVFPGSRRRFSGTYPQPLFTLYMV